VTHPFGELSPQRLTQVLALRRLRVDAGLSAQQLAELAGLSQSRVSRIERGDQSVRVAVVEQWAKAAGASEADLAAVLELAEAAATQAVAWRKTQGLRREQDAAREAEASAATILSYQPLLIPGLLQISEYARRIFAAGYPPPSPEEVAAAVTARMERKPILYAEGKRIEFVIGEAALHQQVGPLAVMRMQLDHISAVAGSVALGVIPFTTDLSAWHEHAFTVLDDRGDEKDPLVHFETLTGATNVADSADVAAYRDAFDHLRSAAVTGEDAARIVREIAGSLP
jgi:transcriptional regulator with XRE-family HTH domain